MQETDIQGSLLVNVVVLVHNPRLDDVLELGLGMLEVFYDGEEANPLSLLHLFMSVVFVVRRANKGHTNCKELDEGHCHSKHHFDRGQVDLMAFNRKGHDKSLAWHFMTHEYSINLKT